MHQTTLVLSLLLAVTATASASGLSGGRREPSAWQALSGTQPLPRAPVFNVNVNWPNGHGNSQERPTYDPSVRQKMQLTFSLPSQTAPSGLKIFFSALFDSRLQSN